MLERYKTLVAAIGIAITLITGLWKASSAWTELNDRVKALEHEQVYYHGAPPVGAAK